VDDIRYMAGQELRLRQGAAIDVIDPTKSYQTHLAGAVAVCRIAHRSIDARGGDLHMVYRIDAWYANESRYEYQTPDYKDVADAKRVIVIGSGPAGMFAALKLVELGMKPIILERGKDVHGRKKDMARASKDGVIDPDSNYCYGEGGAGTFSDGKLYTRSSKRGNVAEVLGMFVDFGADRSILIDAHPHIGTDKLPRVVENIRKCIVEHGGEYHFGNKVTDIKPVEGGFEVTATTAEGSVTYEGLDVILATGHSARDIYEMASSKGWQLEAKGFAMGVRVEHPQRIVNRIRYRGQWEPGMPAAEYSFVEQVCDPEDDETTAKGVFSFCMCPGGILVPTATEDDTTVLNGMSNSARNSKWANAGVVVSIEPGDEPEEYRSHGAFSLLDFQHDVEKKMYDYVASYRETHPEVSPLAAPAQRMADFCEGEVSEDLPETSYHPGVVSAPLHELLPAFVSNRLQQVFPLVEHHGFRGYYTNDALLLGVESRTSSPVRMVRDEAYQAVGVPGLFPCGEGAGYSGGIVSSAIDGINCALAVYDKEHPSRDEERQPAEDEG